MAYICQVSPRELYGKIIQSLEVVAGVCDAIRFKAQPADSLQDTLKVPPFFCFGICIIITKVAVSVVMCRVTKVDEDSFGVTDV